jgi:hypothetical protein
MSGTYAGKALGEDLCERLCYSHTIDVLLSSIWYPKKANSAFKRFSCIGA